jgi:hypothetical protein
MAAMTEAVQQVIPLQRDRRGPAASAAPPAPMHVVRITTDSPLGAQLLLPASADPSRIAPLLPIQRDRRSRQAAPVRRMTRLAVALGSSVLVWLAIVAAVVTLGHTL